MPFPRLARLGLSNGELASRRYSNAGKKRGHRRCVEPDWAALHHELRRKHVRLSILWDKYIEQYPDGYDGGILVMAALFGVYPFLPKLWVPSAAALAEWRELSAA